MQRRVHQLRFTSVTRAGSEGPGRLSEVSPLRMVRAVQSPSAPLAQRTLSRFAGTQPLARGSVGCNDGRMITDGRGEERESLAAPGAFAGTAAVRYDEAAEAIAWGLLGNGLENVTFTGR